MSLNPFQKLYMLTGEDGMVFSGYKLELPERQDLNQQGPSSRDFVTTEKTRTKFWNSLSGIKRTETTTVLPGSGSGIGIDMIIEKKISYLYKTDPNN